MVSLSSLRPYLCLEVMCSKQPFVTLDSKSLPLGLPPALYLQVVCSKKPVVPLDSLSPPLGLRLALSSSGALEEDCCASGFTLAASGSAFSSLSSSGALEEAVVLLPLPHGSILLAAFLLQRTLLRGIRFFQHQLHRFNSFLLAFTTVL